VLRIAPVTGSINRDAENEAFKALAGLQTGQRRRMSPVAGNVIPTWYNAESSRADGGRNRFSQRTTRNETKKP
jgi:hypothetical protein